MTMNAAFNYAIAAVEALEDDGSATIPFDKAVIGNELFERVLDSVLLDHVFSLVLLETLGIIGSSPATMSMEELTAMLPEIERRLRQIVQPERARRTLARVRTMILDYEP
jgi:hypothetical protein